VLQKVSKNIFGVKKYDSITMTLLETGLPALTLCVQIPVLMVTVDGHTATTPWSLCCVHNCLSCIS